MTKNEQILRDLLDAKYPDTNSPHGSVIAARAQSIATFTAGFKAALAATEPDTEQSAVDMIKLIREADAFSPDAEPSAPPVTPKHIEEIKDLLSWPVTEDDAQAARDMLQSLHFDLSMAESAPAQQAEAPGVVYQVEQYGWASMWMDASRDEYERATTEKRTLYTRPATSQSADQVRDTALEEAAKVCDLSATWAKGEIDDMGNSDSFRSDYIERKAQAEQDATAIRALKSSPRPAASESAEARAALTIGDAFKQVGGWMNGGELGYPSFGSMDALRFYTQKIVRAALAISSADLTDTQRLDHLEAWRLSSIAQGFSSDTYQLITDIPVREQLDREIDASSAAKGASNGN